MNSTNDIRSNIDKAFEMIENAGKYQSDVIALPECFAYMIKEGVKPEFEKQMFGEILDELSKLSKKINSYILAGTLPEESEEKGKYYNTSLLIDREGNIKAKYRKIHLFDIIQGNSQLQESKYIKRGDDIVSSDIDGVKVGFSICYDLRFPELYRKLVDKGVKAIFIPAAFTMKTGKDHWEILLRSRAIENQCYIIAPAQTGKHDETRESYGNSMIIDPWGVVIARKGEEEGILNADIDFNYVDEVRNRIPSIKNRVLISKNFR